MPERNGVGMGCPPESVPALLLGLAPLLTTSLVALIMCSLRAARLTTLATKLRLHQAARRCSFFALPALNHLVRAQRSAALIEKVGAQNAN